MRGFITYHRVSTAKQGRSGLGLSAQQHTAEGFLRTIQDAKLIAEFVEVEHGTKRGNNRPKLAAALAMCRIHGATLLISKLDRLSRCVSFISALMDSGVDFCACDNPHATRLTIHILAAIAEDEALRISQRTKDALAAAKRRGTPLGGDRGRQTRSQLLAANAASAQVRSAAAQQRAADLQPIIEELRSAGCSTLASIAEGLNQRGITTARGSQWSPAQVYRVLA